MGCWNLILTPARLATGDPRNREEGWPGLGLSVPSSCFSGASEQEGWLDGEGCVGASAGLQGLSRAACLSKGLSSGKSPTFYVGSAPE